MDLQTKQYVRRMIEDPGWAFVAFQRRLVGHLTYTLFEDYSPFPKMVAIWPTYRCNLRCSFCGQWGPTGTNFDIPESELNGSLTLDDWKALIDDVARYKPTIFIMGGGEPTLFRGWLDLIEYATEKGCPTMLVTNGLTLAGVAERIVKSGLRFLAVSIDGPPEIHDEIRGLPGACARSLHGAKAVIEARKRLEHKTPLMSMHCVISSLNYRYLDEVVDMGESVGFDDISFGHLEYVEPEARDYHMKFFKHTFDVSTDNHWSGYLSDLHKDIDLDDLVETIDRLASRNGVPVRFKPAFDAEEVRAYYTDPYFTPKHYNKGCKIAWLSGLVYPNGDVSVCPNYIAGNIKEQPFSAIFNNDRYRSFRRTVKEVGLFPACTKCCWLYWA